MKKFLVWVLGVTVVSLAGCGSISMPQAGIRIDNPDGKQVKFSGYYESDSGRYEVDGVTMATYKVKINQGAQGEEGEEGGDQIRVALVKTDTTDSVNELRVKLFYAGRKGIAKVTKPGDSAIIEYNAK